ncbi:hypothetical protein [Tateyamaria sp.]|uniref:hypothetical protein n=1 Tax=Tateyamaria sp. TaxID=1929288 RepID=UPI00329ECEB1
MACFASAKNLFARVYVAFSKVGRSQTDQQGHQEGCGVHPHNETPEVLRDTTQLQVGLVLDVGLPTKVPVYGCRSEISWITFNIEVKIADACWFSSFTATARGNNRNIAEAMFSATIARRTPSGRQKKRAFVNGRIPMARRPVGFHGNNFLRRSIFNNLT